MLLDKMERKFGRFAIPHLMRYVVFGTAIVFVISIFKPEFLNYIVLTREAITKGQVWRLVTFIFYPPMSSSYFSVIISLYCYYWIGNALEAAWGAFRFNLYYLCGMLMTAIMILIFGGIGLPTYMNQMLFLTLATLFPNQQVLFMFFIPLRSIWVALIGAGWMVYDYFTVGSYLPFFRTLILAAVLNYAIFFLPKLIQRVKYRKRRNDYQKQVSGAYRRVQRPEAGKRPGASAAKADSDRGKIIKGVSFHKCHICGITDVDDPDMTFRYCSQCNGNYEYCEEHLHNHEHVK